MNGREEVDERQEGDLSMAGKELVNGREAVGEWHRRGW